MSLDAVVYTPEAVDQYDDVGAAIAAPGETWIHVENADETNITTLQSEFDIHQLAIEDVLDEQNRPKTEEYETHTFVLMKTTRLSQRESVAFHKEVQTTSVGFFIGDDWLVTLSTGDLENVEPTGPAWTRHSDRVAARGADFLAYRLIDTIVDGYFDILDEIEDDIELVEERILSEPDPRMIEDLNNIRRDLLAFRKVAWPAREAISSLSRGDIPQVDDNNEKYFRDVYDHLVQVVDLIETYRDLTGGSRDIYLNTVSQSTNDVMKTLTIVATIFIPLTFVAGLYGMNFSGTALAMPELSWTYGYPAAMLGMTLIAVVMLDHFRRQEWL